MANPTRPDPTGTQSATRPTRNNAKSWGLYLVIAVIALLVMLFLFGGFGGPDETVTTGPTIDEVPAALPEGDAALTNGAVIPPDNVQPDAAQSSVPTEAVPGAPAADGDAEPVIVIKGDAEVEVLDEN